MMRRCASICLAVLLIVPGLSVATALLYPRVASAALEFDTAEIQVFPSPNDTQRIELGQGEKVVDFDVSPTGPEVAVIVRTQKDGARILFWNLGSAHSRTPLKLPSELTAHSIAWHPSGRKLFLAGSQGAQHVIVSVSLETAEDFGTAPNAPLKLKRIYSSSSEIRRLVPGPRPFMVHSASGEDRSSHRLFFGLRGPDATYSIRSVTEEGEGEYQVAGPEKGFTSFKMFGETLAPSRIKAPSALPLAFHSGGHLLLWEDPKHCFHSAQYGRDRWEKSSPLFEGRLCGGTVTPTPNGLGILHWKPGTQGVTLYYDRGKTSDVQAPEYTFLATPSSVPDGKGIIGLIKSEQAASLVYVPIRMPLADVMNAWMFLESPSDRKLFSDSGGLFRDLKADQLYALYETEAYQCASYDPNTPTRPYLVTSDIFWELFAAAYEGTFIVKEQQQAIPAFWEFVRKADQWLRESLPQSRWAGVFSALSAVEKGSGEPGKRGVKSVSEPSKATADIQTEADRILGAKGVEFSPVLGEEADYEELKPRGHYTSEPNRARYFKAFKYLTELAGKSRALDLNELKLMPLELKQKALAWIRPYEGFISLSRTPLVWKQEGPGLPAYARHPLSDPRLFPLSWGFDNEVLLSTVYHENWPEAEQIKGPGGTRLMPSGLDIASAMGSRLALALLSDEIVRYPVLKKVIEELRSRFESEGKIKGERSNLYDQWIAALGAQWAKETASPNGKNDERLWHAKRLQTGLASWATLRHATVLVNERTAAECGEGGFEPILMRPPRGYVEPDPKTFEAIAALFDALRRIVEAEEAPFKGRMDKDLPSEEASSESESNEPLKQGILRRLTESAQKARLFKTMAEKELRSEALTGGEYEEILYVGRVAEHLLLLFKSLASEEHGLSTPDPMPKIADVSGGGPLRLPYLMVGVGRPLEWDHIVPYFGRREIVKGVAYSYYEFQSQTLLNDREWLKKLPAQPHPAWISPFVSRDAASCPPRAPY